MQRLSDLSKFILFLKHQLKSSNNDNNKTAIKPHANYLIAVNSQKAENQKNKPSRSNQRNERKKWQKHFKTFSSFYFFLTLKRSLHPKNMFKTKSIKKTHCEFELKPFWTNSMCSLLPLKRNLMLISAEKKSKALARGGKTGRLFPL